MDTSEKRASERIHIEIPVYIGQEELVTRDVSQAGIYFLSDYLYAKGRDVNFSLVLDYAFPKDPIKLNCQGKIVRAERLDGKFGIAAKIKDLQLIH